MHDPESAHGAARVLQAPPSPRLSVLRPCLLQLLRERRSPWGSLYGLHRFSRASLNLVETKLPGGPWHVHYFVKLVIFHTNPRHTEPISGSVEKRSRHSSAREGILAARAASCTATVCRRSL